MLGSRLIGAACLAVLLGVGPAPQTAAAVDPACSQPPPRSGVIREVPWAQQYLYDPANKVCPFSRGSRVTVAVIDAGVDAAHPQLRGRVRAGYDFVRDTREGDVDCLPHGTGVASIIAATKVRGIGFVGLAPRATILPVRVTDKVHLSPQSERLDPGALADGIDYAVDQGAQVLHISTVLYNDDAKVAQAIDRALFRGVVVVAPVGNGHQDRDGSGPTTPSLTPYPAAYPGVVGVGAVGPDRQRIGSSQVGPYVDVVAPGADVTAAGVQGHGTYDGTEFAAAFVSASAALLLSQRATLLGNARGRALVAAVTKRLVATASPAAGGPSSLAYGHGLVDPYRALTEPTVGGSPSALPRHSPPPRNLEAEQLARQRQQVNDRALLLGSCAVVLVLVILVGALFLPRGRRRRWQPGEGRAAALSGCDSRSEFLPGHALFEPAPERINAKTSSRT